MKNKTKKLSKYKPASDEFEFRQFPFYWMMKLSNRYAHQMEVALKKVNMNISYWRVGMILREHGVLSISEIATHAVYRLPTITKTVYKMQENGFVTIKPNDDDRRVSMVTITDQGLETIESIITNTTDVFNNAFDGMTEAQLRNLTSSLQHIFSNLSEE